MSKTITLRLEDALYREFRHLAALDHRPLANWIVTSTLKHVEECQFVDDLEMTDLRADRELTRVLRRGSEDARLKRGRFVA